jgi:hypothetical protein
LSFPDIQDMSAVADEYCLTALPPEPPATSPATSPPASSPPAPSPPPATSRRLDDSEKGKLPEEEAKLMGEHVLRKLYTGGMLFESYKKEKARLMRRAMVAYSVAAVLALLFAAGVASYYVKSRKYYAVAPAEDGTLETEEGGAGAMLRVGGTEREYEE